MRTWLAARLRTRKGFLIYSLAVMGTLSWLVAVWYFEVYPDPGLIFLLGVFAYIGAYWWGLAMWAFYMRPLLERSLQQSASTASRNDNAA
jgi:hypothetical protein